MTLIQFPNPQVEHILGPLTSAGDPALEWYDETRQRQAQFWAQYFLANTVFVSSNHYDLPLCLYAEFYRTNDEEYRRLARLVAERWWRGPHVRSGMPVGGGDKPDSKYAGLAGLCLWALDGGDPLVWGWAEYMTREWVDIRLTGKLAAPDIYSDVRDEGYILLYALLLARALPDSFPQIVWDNNLNTSTVQVTDGAARRAKFLVDAERAAVEYFGRLQEADGSWRWRAWNPEPALKAKIDAELSAGRSDKFEQPFMGGILMEAYGRLYQTTQSESVKASNGSSRATSCRPD